MLGEAGTVNPGQAADPSPVGFCEGSSLLQDGQRWLGLMGSQNYVGIQKHLVDQVPLLDTVGMGRKCQKR